MYTKADLHLGYRIRSSRRKRPGGRGSKWAHWGRRACRARRWGEQGREGAAVSAPLSLLSCLYEIMLFGIDITIHLWFYGRITDGVSKFQWRKRKPLHCFFFRKLYYKDRCRMENRLKVRVFL